MCGRYFHGQRFDVQVAFKPSSKLADVMRISNLCYHTGNGFILRGACSALNGCNCFERRTIVGRLQILQQSLVGRASALFRSPLHAFGPNLDALEMIDLV